MHSNEVDTLPTIYASFTIRGFGLDLPAITKGLGIEPSSSRGAGSRWRKPPRPQLDVWTIKGPERRSVEGGPAIEQMVDRLDRVRDKLQQLRSKYPDAIYDLALVVYITSPGCVLPDITMSSELMARMGWLGLRFSVSGYAVADE